MSIGQSYFCNEMALALKLKISDLIDMSITEIEQNIEALPSEKKIELFGHLLGYFNQLCGLLHHQLAIQTTGESSPNEEKDSLKTVTVEELREHLSDLEAWLGKEGKIQVIQHGQAIAWINVARRPQSQKFEVSEVMTRLRERCEGRILTAEESREMLQASRGDH